MGLCNRQEAQLPPVARACADRNKCKTESYRRTKSLRVIRLRLGPTQLESTVSTSLYVRYRTDEKKINAKLWPLEEGLLPAADRLRELGFCEVVIQKNFLSAVSSGSFRACDE